MDLCYTLQLSAKIRKFALDNQLVVNVEELKDVMRERRQELEEKRRSCLHSKQRARSESTWRRTWSGLLKTAAES